MKIAEAQLRRHVDERYVERGRECAACGLVVLYNVTDTQAKANCSGSRSTVALNLRNSRLSGVCSCPAFEDLPQIHRLYRFLIAMPFLSKASVCT